MPRGLFISFEGSEGCGKFPQIQQIQRLAAHLGGIEISEQLQHSKVIS